MAESDCEMPISIRTDLFPRLNIAGRNCLTTAGTARVHPQLHIHAGGLRVCENTEIINKHRKARSAKE